MPYLTVRWGRSWNAKLGPPEKSEPASQAEWCTFDRRCVVVSLFDVVGLIWQELGALCFSRRPRELSDPTMQRDTESLGLPSSGQAGRLARESLAGFLPREPALQMASKSRANSSANISAPTHTKRKQMHSKYFIDIPHSLNEGMTDIAYHKAE